MAMVSRWLLLTTACNWLSLPSAQGTLSGSVSIPSVDTYRILPNFTGNASSGFVSVQTNNTPLSSLLIQAQNATFIAYDEEFLEIIGSNSDALLIAEQPDLFAYEVVLGRWRLYRTMTYSPQGAAYDHVRNQVWFASCIFTDQPTKLRRLNLTDNSVHIVNTPLLNMNGAYYSEGWVYLTYLGNIGTNPGIGRVNAETYETEIVLNSYQGLAFNGPDDVVVVPANHSRNKLSETQLFFTDNSYGLTDRPISDYQLPNAVWRFTPSTGALVPVIARADIVGPNGVRVNANGTKLYVGEYDAVLKGLDIGFQCIGLKESADEYALICPPETFPALQASSSSIWIQEDSRAARDFSVLRDTATQTGYMLMTMVAFGRESPRA